MTEGYSLRDVGKLLGLPRSIVCGLIDAGFVAPSRGQRGEYRFSFQDLALHRVEAACLPNNTASIRLLEKVGFAREGYARRYLCIDGRWQDHLLYGLVRDDPRR